MAHYAFLNNDNIVTEVIVGIDETELIEGLDTETWYGNFRGQVCKRTSYNTLAGVHYNHIENENENENGRPTKVPSQKIAFRKNYAGIGYSYDELRDAFIPPKPFVSWILNEDTCNWEAPVPYPTDGSSYEWNEDTIQWEIVIFESEQTLESEEIS